MESNSILSSSSTILKRMILKNDCAWARLPKVRYGTLAFFGAIVCYGWFTKTTYGYAQGYALLHPEARKSTNTKMTKKNFYSMIFYFFF